VRRKYLHHVAAEAKRLEYFAWAEGARKHGDIRAMRGIDYFRYQARGDDESRTGINRASHCFGVSHRPRSDKHFAREAFRDCADRVDRIRNRHRDFGDCEPSLQQRFYNCHRGVSAGGADDRYDSNLAKR
jgi:hypothetical protein